MKAEEEWTICLQYKIKMTSIAIFIYDFFLMLLYIFGFQLNPGYFKCI